MYDLGQIEKDIENVKMPLHGDFLEGASAFSYSLVWKIVLCEMGYSNFISKRGHVAVKHIRKRINHPLLRSPYEEHRRDAQEGGYERRFLECFVRRMTDEDEAIDTLESKKTLETSDSDSDEQAGPQPPATAKTESQTQERFV